MIPLHYYLLSAFKVIGAIALAWGVVWLGQNIQERVKQSPCQLQTVCHDNQLYIASSCGGLEPMFRVCGKEQADE